MKTISLFSIALSLLLCRALLATGPMGTTNPMEVVEPEATYESAESADIVDDLDKYYKKPGNRIPYKILNPTGNTTVPPIQSGLCPFGYRYVVLSAPPRGPVCCLIPSIVNASTLLPLCLYVPMPIGVQCISNQDRVEYGLNSRTGAEICGDQCSANVCDAGKMGVLNNDKGIAQGNPLSQAGAIEACEKCCHSNMQPYLNPFPTTNGNTFINLCTNYCARHVAELIASGISCSPPMVTTKTNNIR